MVESINNVLNTTTETKKDNAGRNAAIAGGLGLIGGGATGYLTKQIYKDDKFTDEFIKNFRNEILNQACEDKADRKALKEMINLGDNPSIDELKKFMKKHLDFVKSKNKNIDINTILNSEYQDDFINLCKETKKSLLEAIQIGEEKLLTYFDKDTNCFKLSLDLNDKAYHNVVAAGLNAKEKVKGKAGLIWGITTGAILGLGTFITSKVNGNKAE